MIRSFGEAALLVECGSSERAQALAASLQAEPIAGVTAVVPGFDSLLVELEPPDAEVRTVLAERLKRVAETVPSGRERTIPVVYGGEHGPDLAEVAALTGLTEVDAGRRHAGTRLRVLFLGFAPGFAYLGGLPDELRVPRLPTPRIRTPAGSVAIAEGMSGIYPAALPGGWRVIGRTPMVLFDPRRDPPAYLAPGDVVRFEPIDADAWEQHAGVPDDWG